MELFWNWIERGLTTEGQIYKLQTRICEPNQDAHTTEDGSTAYESDNIGQRTGVSLGIGHTLKIVYKFMI